MPGIQSLMPQGPVPGQAPQQPMQGMMPKPGASTPPAQIKFLETKPSQELRAMYDQQPSLALLTAYTKAVKREALDASMRGQQAMQQAAGAPATIADSIMQQPVMAAHGGEMHSYAGGGAVSFSRGGDPEEERLRQQIKDMFESASSPFNILGPRAGQDRQRAQDIIRMLPNLDKEQMRNILGQTQRTVDPTAYQEFGPGERMEQMAPPVSVPPGRGMAEGRVTPQAAPQAIPKPSPTTFDISSPSSINALRIAAQDTTLPESERADLQRRIAMMEGQRPTKSGVATLAKPQATLTPEEEQSYANRASTLRTRQGLPEDVLTGRQGIATLAAENLAAQRAEREQLAREAKEQRDAAIGRAQRGIMDDPMALLTLAGSIDTRRGQGVGSLARGAAGLMGKREEQAEAARKEFALAQRDQRMLQANERQANMLEMQRQQAIRENDFTRVSQIEDQLATLELQKSQLLRSRQEHAEKMTLEERKVGAMESEAVAKLGRPTEIDFFRQDPEGYGRFQAARRGPQTAGERQDLAELKTLQGNLQKQVENYMIPKPQRNAAAAQLEQVNAKIAQMAGLDSASTAPTQLPSAALAQLKEGVVTKFANGQQWTLKNGQPTQVK